MEAYEDWLMRIDNHSRLTACFVPLQGYFGETCSFSASALSYGQSVTKAETSFQYEYFELPSFASHSSMAEVRFACSFHSRYYSAWTTSRPELLLLKVTAKMMFEDSAWLILLIQSASS